MTPKTIKDIIREIIQESQLLTEGMNVVVVGAPQERFDTLDGITYHLTNKCLKPIADNWPPDQLRYFMKNGVGWYDVIVPDGTYYGSQKPNVGIINVYVSGFTRQVQQQLFINIFKELKRLNIKWGKIKKEQSQMFKSEVVRIPIVINNNIYGGPPEIHLSNRNAQIIFRDILQFDGEYHFDMTAKELKDAIDSLEHDQHWIDAHNIDTTMDKGEPEVGDEWKGDAPEGGVTMINMGLNSEDIWGRLRIIRKVAIWAIENGFDKIVVG